MAGWMGGLYGEGKGEAAWWWLAGGVSFTDYGKEGGQKVEGMAAPRCLRDQTYQAGGQRSGCQVHSTHLGSQLGRSSGTSDAKEEEMRPDQKKSWSMRFCKTASSRRVLLCPD